LAACPSPSFADLPDAGWSDRTEDLCAQSDSWLTAAEIGDRDWDPLLDAHDAVVRAQLTRFRGREVNTSGDGFLAMFDGPQRAIRCAMAIRDAVQALGLQVRAGLHAGECEIRGDDIGGIGAHIGARVSALAGPTTCCCPARCATW
jgi:class 3 adenylate cyclase